MCTQLTVIQSMNGSREANVEQENRVLGCTKRMQHLAVEKKKKKRGRARVEPTIRMKNEYSVTKNNIFTNVVYTGRKWKRKADRYINEATGPSKNPCAL